jgi:hypothetical protein
MTGKDFYYEYKGLKYKSILELKLNNHLFQNKKSVKCFSEKTDTLGVYFVYCKLTDVLSIKDSLLKSICKNSECNYTINNKYSPKHLDYKYFTIEEGNNEIGFFHYAIINKKDNSFLLIVIGNNDLTQKTKSRINTMFGYLIL